ncbi:DUF3300 domain-containing protein [Paraglaciecola aestuariivivens]
MQNPIKSHLANFIMFVSLLGGSVPFAQGQDNSSQGHNYSELDSQEYDTQTIEPFSQAELEQMLAPIALYPDTLLSHILIASTYPLELVQAARWRAANKHLDTEQVMDAIEDKNWDPSVKALVPFDELLRRLDQDLDWLQNLGLAFLHDEERLLASVQKLRQHAYQNGNLDNNQYVKVSNQDQQIVVESVQKHIIYVPYYDTRVVYGNWWWDHHHPVFWHSPRHAVYHAGFYWSLGFAIRPSFYFGGFHWHKRQLVADYHYRHTAHRSWAHYTEHHPRVRVKEYPRWSKQRQPRKSNVIAHYGHKKRLTSYAKKTQQPYALQRNKKHLKLSQKLSHKDVTKQAYKVSKHANKAKVNSGLNKPLKAAKQGVQDKKRRLNLHKYSGPKTTPSESQVKAPHNNISAPKPTKVYATKHNERAVKSPRFNYAKTHSAPKSVVTKQHTQGPKSISRQKH